MSTAVQVAVPLKCLPYDRKSSAELLALLPPTERTAYLDRFSTAEQIRLLHSWEFWARPQQLPPEGDWTTWIIEAGRGYGKTRPGAEWVIRQAQAIPNCRIALGGQTPDDYRDTMIEGESGILNCSPPW